MGRHFSRIVCACVYIRKWVEKRAKCVIRVSFFYTVYIYIVRDDVERGV